MIPAAFVFLDALPRTPNGKIDRQALPAPAYNTAGREMITSLPERLSDPTAVRSEQRAAPLMTIHHQLIQLWEKALNIHPIGIHENFFELGGHSLLAARLAVEIEQACGKKLPLTTFISGPTIARLADILLGAEETRSRAPAIAIQVSGTLPPFFFLHGDWIGGGFYCLDLARSLGSEQPFYVLEPYMFANLPVPPSLEKVAAAHIESMRAVQPEGPYYFGGFCNGGLIAFEMARQLQAVGEVVALLLLVDPAVPTPHKAVRENIQRTGKILGFSEEQQVNWFLRYLYLRMPHFQARFEGTRHLAAVDEIELGRTGHTPRSLRQKRAIIPPPAKVLRQQWSGIYRWVAAGYVPRAYTGKATFLWSSAEFPIFARYKQAAQQAEIHVFPGTHMGWKTQNLPLLAEQMRIYLNQAHQEAFRITRSQGEQVP